MKETGNNVNYSAFAGSLYDDKKIFYGNNTNIMYVIKQKMKINSELSRLIGLFASEDDDAARIKLTEKILFSLTNAGNVKVNAKGNFINAKYLYVLETLDKLLLISFSKKNCGHVYSELELADLINREFENLEIETYAKLMHHFYFEKHLKFINPYETDREMNYISEDGEDKTSVCKL